MQQQIPMLAEVHKPRFATTTELVLASRSLSSSIALAIQRWSSGALRGFLRKVAWNEMLERKRDTR